MSKAQKITMWDGRKLTLEEIRALKKIRNPRLDVNGAEVLDPIPVALPVPSHLRPPTLEQQIQQVLRPGPYYPTIFDSGRDDDFGPDIESDDFDTMYQVAQLDLQEYIEAQTVGAPKLANWLRERFNIPKATPPAEPLVEATPVASTEAITPPEPAQE